MDGSKWKTGFIICSISISIHFSGLVISHTTLNSTESECFYNRVKCTASKAEEKSVFEQYGLVNDLIEEIKALTLDYPDRKPQLINAIEQLNAMKAKRLGKCKLFH